MHQRISIHEPFRYVYKNDNRQHNLCDHTEYIHIIIILEVFISYYLTNMYYSKSPKYKGPSIVRTAENKDPMHGVLIPHRIPRASEQQG